MVEMSPDGYQVQLTDVFEGPMDLLIHLIKKNEVDIYDIPIAHITEQYLAYLDWMKSMNIDFAGEFLVMASTLAQIKSRMLLPAAQENEDEEDPRMEIVRPLTEYIQIKEAAQDLSHKNILGFDTFSRSTSTQFDPSMWADEQLIQVGLFELIDAFHKILNRMAPEQRVELSADHISVKDRITQLVDLLEQHGSLVFEELFLDQPLKKEDLIVTFLALLEMVKLNLIKLIQHQQTGVIRIFYQ